MFDNKIVVYDKLVKFIKDNMGFLTDSIKTTIEISEGVKNIKSIYNDNEREIKRLELLYKEFSKEEVSDNAK